MSIPGEAGAQLLAAGAGSLLALAAREAVVGTPALAAWARQAVEPLGRAAREGYSPSITERRRLALLGAIAALALGLAVAGPRLGVVLAIAGPLVAAWGLARGRGRYRRGVERALPEIAAAVADSLSAGRSLRFSLASAAESLEGPAAVELARLGAELQLGAPTEGALGQLRRRMRSARVDAFASALASQQLAGGDLAALLRRFADGAAEQDRVAEDARSATAQARFTGLLVVAMPSGAALFAELVQPGFIGGLLRVPAATAMLALAAALQLAGFAAIRKLARVST